TALFVSRGCAMTITDRDLKILRQLRRYFYLHTSQIRDRIAPHDKDGSIMRARLRKLEQAGLIQRYQPKMIDPLSSNGSASPVFALTIKGSCVLSQMTNDMSLTLTLQPTFTNWM